MAGHSQTHPIKGLISNNVAIISEIRENYFYLQIFWLLSPHAVKKGTASSSVAGRQNFTD